MPLKRAKCLGLPELNLDVMHDCRPAADVGEPEYERLRIAVRQQPRERHVEMPGGCVVGLRDRRVLRDMLPDQ
jgi:hypothetical protein